MEEFEGRDIFADDFIRQEEFIEDMKNPSEIQKFFEDTNIFITGGTGFLGRILIEKLLRDCSGLKKIYLLMRPKKGKSVQERYDEQFDGPVFQWLRAYRPDFKSKVSIISGDLAEEKDFMSEEDKQMLIETVHIIFHCAATVRFDEKIRRACNINIKATKFLVDMAQEMKKLKAFVHVSTAYSNCPHKEIGEQFYPPPYNYTRIMNIVNVLDDALLEKVTPDLLGQYPNTYAFTKMIGEDIIREYGKGLPIAILRPSIVVSAYKEPLAGWINNYYGPQGVVFGAALGLLRTLHCDPNVIADLVPVDLVINALIALAWDVGHTKGDNPNFEEVPWKETSDDSNIGKTESGEEIPILNYVSSERNPINWGWFLECNYKSGQNNHSPYILWHFSLTLNANYYKDRVTRIFSHYLPALVVDFIAVLLRKKPILWNTYKKIHKFSAVISYFCTSQWKFREENVVKLLQKLSKKDKYLFNFDIKDLSWEHYIDYYIRGIRVYLVQDSMASLPQGRKRALRLKIYHYLLVSSLYLLLFYVLYKIYCLFV